MKRAYTIALVIGVAAVACKKTEPAETTSAAEVAHSPSSSDRVAEGTSEAEAEQQPLTAADIDWRQESVTAIGISLPTIEGLDLRRGGMGESSYIRQARDPLAMSFWYGPGRTVEAWREGYKHNQKAKLGPPEKLRVCGSEAVRQTVSLPEMKVPYRPMAMELGPEAQAAIAAYGGSKPATTETQRERWARQGYREVPAKTATVLGFKHAGTDVIASFIVETERLDEFGDVQRAFFDGIRCAE